MARKPKETMRFIPALYSNPTFLKFQFNQEWYVDVLLLNLYFIYSLIYVCNMYVLKSKK